MLSRIPHKEFLNLAVIYRVIIEEGNAGCASMAVTNNFCDAYSISRDELDAAAWKNTENSVFYSSLISELLKNINGMPENIEKVPMWILTNPVAINGAAVMLYKKYFNDLAEQLESDLYVLPSSICEVIAVPINVEKLDSLKKMVRKINATKVAEEKVLSDNVYRYNRDSGKLFIV